MALLSIAAALCCATASVRAEGSCKQAATTQFLAVLLNPLQTFGATSKTEFIPAGNDAQIIIDRPFDANDRYGALVSSLENIPTPISPSETKTNSSPAESTKSGASPSAEIQKPQPAAGDAAKAQGDQGKPPADESKVTPLDTEQYALLPASAKKYDDASTIVTLSVPPRLGGAWREGTIFIFACTNAHPDVVFVSRVTAPFSWRGYCIPLAAIAVVSVYFLTAAAVHFRDVKRAIGKRWTYDGWIRTLDPVLLTAGPTNQGSLARLQMAFFSLIVFGLLAYIVMRTGALSDLSPTILELLGISGVGAAASTATEASKNRLAFENWTWLIRRDWLSADGWAGINKPRWRDLVVTDDGFDVYHFQMLIFSLVVGGALLDTGLTDLAAFQVPQSLLGVLGLSQVVYVGGKLVSPPSYAELNSALTNLRDLEAKLQEPANG